MELLQLYMLLALLVPLLLVFLRKKNGRQRRIRPPGPPPLPIIGNLHHLRSSLAPHHHLHHLSQKYGPLMSLKLGSIPALVVSSAKMAKVVMKTQDIAFSGRPAFLSFQKLSYGGFDMAFAPYGQYWRDIRKVCVLHLFSVKMVNSFRPVREDEVQRMLKRISISKIANLSELCMSLTNNITCRTAFGKRFEHEEFDAREGLENRQFHKLMHEGQALMVAQHLSDYFPFMGCADRLGMAGRRLDKVFKELDVFYQERIDEHLEAQQTCRPSQHEDIIDILLNLKEEGSLTTDQIKAVLMNILFGGTDTSAAAIVWTMTLLMKNPGIMRRAQDQVRNLVKQEKEGNTNIVLVTEDELEKLAYLKAVVKESLRLQPVVPLLIPHQTIKHCTIDGYEINPGTLVHINAWSIGRDPASWESPDEFRPERFLGSNSLDYTLGQDFGFIPFGAGRRGCPGMNLGVATVELALANLLYSFDWDFPEGMKAEDVDTDVLLGLVTHKKTPLCLRPKSYQI